MAHIANCLAPKKIGAWERADFIRLSSDPEKVAPVRESFKDVKKKLGSTFKLNAN